MKHECGVREIMNLPMRAFCLNGNAENDKIEIIINEVFDFLEKTSFRGGYDFVGRLLRFASRVSRIR